jgi:hypothetical protein
MVWVAVGEMAGAIVPASTFTIRGKGITMAAGITRSSITVAAGPSEVASMVAAGADSTAVVEVVAATAAAVDTAKINFNQRL